MKRQGKIILCMLMTLTTVVSAQLKQNLPVLDSEIAKAELQNSQWKAKKVAFLGDSMTQKRDSNNIVYWEYLADILGIESFVYGISGHQWDNIYRQATKLKTERGADVDAIFIFAGTNDFNHGIPLGEFFTETQKETNHNGKQVIRKYRTHIMNDSTFCGRINKVMDFLKSNYPDQQIIILTPIHRGFAQFSERNVQPDENFANAQGLYIDDYVKTLKEAASIWSVPLIDLFSLSGLFPLKGEYSKFFENAEKDMLHPNSAGNYRLAKTIQYQLLSLPSTFSGQLNN